MENVASVVISHQQLNQINEFIYQTFPDVFKFTIKDRSTDLEINISEPGVISSNNLQFANNRTEGAPQINETITIAHSEPEVIRSSRASVSLNITLPKTNVALKSNNSAVGEVSGALRYVLKVYPVLIEKRFKLKVALIEMSFNGTGNDALKLMIKNFMLPMCVNMIKPAFDNLTFDLPTYGKMDANTASIKAMETGIVVNYGNNGSAPGKSNAEVNDYIINRIKWAAFKDMLNSTMKRNFYGRYPSKTNGGDNVTVQYWIDLKNEPKLDKSPGAITLTFDSTFKVEGRVHTPRPLPDYNFNSDTTTEIKLTFTAYDNYKTLHYICISVEMDPKFEWRIPVWQPLTLKEGVKKEILDHAVRNIISQFTEENTPIMLDLPQFDFAIQHKPFVVGSRIENIIHDGEECIIESSLFCYVS